MLKLLWFVVIFIGVQTMYAQDTNAIKKPKENPVIETPKPEEPVKTEPINLNPPTFSGHTTTTEPEPVKVEKTYTPERPIHIILPGRGKDTLPPKYIADASYLPIVTWEMPAIGVEVKEIDSTLSVVKPLILTSQRNDVLLELNTWKQESKEIAIPIKFEGEREVHLSRYFTLAQETKQYKKLYLYFEGLAWRSEVKLNGKFLGINENPFKAWAIPIDVAWLRDEENYLEITLSKQSKAIPLFPKPFLAIFRPAYLVTEAQLAELNKPIMAEVAKTNEPVAIYAPYFHSKGYVFDKFTSISDLLHAKRAGINYVYFVFPPGKELQKLCKQMEFLRVKELNKGQSVAWLNRYPYQPSSFPYIEQFWVDEKGYRTTNYASYIPYASESGFVPTKSISLLFAFCVLFPLLSMAFIKLLNVKFFNMFLEVLVSPRLAIDKFMESTSGNRGLLIILQIIRVAIVGTCLALLADYIQSYNQWHILKPFGDNGIFFALFGAKSPFWINMLKSLILVSIWAVVRMFFIRSLSGLFRIHNMYEGLTNLELIGAYPVVFLLPIPLSMLSFMSYEWHDTLLWIQSLLMLGYLARQVYLCYIGMGKLFGFSLSVRGLYILGGIVFPYLLCL